MISFKCTLRNALGQFISSTYNKDVLTIADPPIKGPLSGLNRNLKDLKKGERRTFKVLAQEAYGLYDPSKVILFPKNKLPDNVKVGERVKIYGKSGKLRTYLVSDLRQDFASLDENHPLAGQDLIFEVEALAARKATDDEIEEALNPVQQQLLH
ncbi:MAG: peptidylprolyl isomerase [Proteobacteria bacterium]|nr:peptidylprolyl isomerase [Pseudomonadota bacterium]